MYLSLVMHLPEDGHMRGRNMQEVYNVYNVLLIHVCAFVGFDAVSNFCM
jgi:hypothetical protein